MKQVSNLAKAKITKLGANAEGEPMKGLNSGIGRGYDVVEERVRAPVYTWTYNDGNAWVSPFDGTTYLYPDQLFETDVPSSKYKSILLFFPRKKDHPHFE